MALLLHYTLTDCDRHFAPPAHCIGEGHKSRHADTLANWLKKVVKIRTSNETNPAIQATTLTMCRDLNQE
jgi:hypothetical protein